MTVELSNTLDVVRKSLNGATDRHERSKIGQFFTPAMIARYMTSLCQRAGSDVWILDPGAGAGVLFASFIEALVSREEHPHSITVVAYENDENVLPYLKDTMDRCQKMCREASISFRGEIRPEHFIASAIAQSDEGLFATKGERFTHAILNPPYKKISSETAMRRSLNAAGLEVSNLYAAFVWLSAKILGTLIRGEFLVAGQGPQLENRFNGDFFDRCSLRVIMQYLRGLLAAGSFDGGNAASNLYCSPNPGGI